MADKPSASRGLSQCYSCKYWLIYHFSILKTFWGHILVIKGDQHNCEMKIETRLCQWDTLVYRKEMLSFFVMKMISVRPLEVFLRHFLRKIVVRQFFNLFIIFWEFYHLEAYFFVLLFLAWVFSSSFWSFLFFLLFAAPKHFFSFNIYRGGKDFCTTKSQGSIYFVVAKCAACFFLVKKIIKWWGMHI